MKKPRILIIDDDANLRKTLSDILSVKGYETLAAKNGAEGLALLKQNSVNAVLIDLRLPDISGLEVLDRVKSEYPSTEAIILTGYAALESAIEATNKGAFSYLKKPYEIDQLLVYIKRAIEKQQAENALKKSEERYRHLTNAVTDYIFTVRIENERPVQTVHSPACAAVTGYTVEDYASDPTLWIRMVHEADREIVLDQSNRILSGQNTQPIEHRILRKDGVIRWVQNTLVPYYDTQGRLLSYDGLIKDITERKQAEEALQESLILIGQAKREWESTVDSIPELICLIDNQGCICRTNRMVEQWNLGQVVNVMGKDLHELLHPGCADSACYLEIFWSQAWEELKHLRSTEREVNDKVLGRYINIQVQPISLKMYRKGEETVSYAAIIIYDITKRKLQEETLRQSENKYRVLIENLPQKIFLKDKNSVYISCNENYARDLKINPDEISGKTDYDFFPKELAEKYRADDKRIVELVNTEDIEERYIQNGREVWVYTVKTPVKDVEGNAVGILGIFWDITKRKQAEDEIRRLNEELEQRVIERTAQLEAINKALEAFSYSVSHDLRVPLRAIDGFSRMLLEGYADKLDDEGKRLLNVIKNNTQKMGELINSFLALSQIGRKEIALSEIDMDKLAKAVFDEIKATIPEGKLQFNIKPIPPVRGDEGMIHQVFFNLLSNAIKFTKPKETAIIEIGGCLEEFDNVYYVKDNGVGFDMQYVDKLFGPFQRLHSDKEFEGTGIGLAIIQRIIHRHGGRVWAEGKVNEGATFYFTLPKLQINGRLYGIER